MVLHPGGCGRVGHRRTTIKKVESPNQTPVGALPHLTHHSHRPQAPVSTGSTNGPSFPKTLPHIPQPFTDPPSAPAGFPPTLPQLLPPFRQRSRGSPAKCEEAPGVEATGREEAFGWGGAQTCGRIRAGGLLRLEILEIPVIKVKKSRKHAEFIPLIGASW
jgi:hypothetical protein